MEAEFYICDAKVENFPAIRKFITRTNNTVCIGPQRQRYVDLENFFRYYATYRLLAYDNEKLQNIVAYAEFRNYPYLWALPSEHWLDFIKTHYCLTIPISVTNVLFLNFCVAEKDLNPSLLKSLLCEVFFRENQLRFILTIEPPHKNEEDRLNYYMFENVSEIYYPRAFSIESCKDTQKLHVMLRTSMLSKMTYRKALPEDNDDVIEVIDVDRPDLREQFGDYFIAEELLRPGVQHNMLIVTEVSNFTAGFIWLNDNVDVLLLLENYEVDVFPNLIKYDPKKPFKDIVITVVALEKKPSYKLFTHEAVNEAIEHEYTGLYLLPSKPSDITLYSQANLRVLSTSGIITIFNERYLYRELFLKAALKISNRFLHAPYYSYRFEKSVNICFNIPEDQILDEDVLLPDHNSNTFAIQLFGMHRNNDIRRLFRLILAAFAAYPEKDYCVFSLPLGTPMTNNIRFMLRYFVRISPRPRCILTDELYMTYRCSIYGEITLHDVRNEDISDIEKIISHNVKNLFDNVIKDRLTSLSKTSSAENYNSLEVSIVNKIIKEVFNNPYSDFIVKTIRCGRSDEPVDKNTLIGFVVLRAFHSVHLLSSHYSLQKNFNSSYDLAEIITMRLHPFYHHQAGVIFRELARLTHYFQYYYFQNMTHNSNSLPNDLVLNMQPIEPKPYKKINKAVPPFDPADGNPNKNDIYEGINYVTDKYAVYYNNLCPLKFCGNDKPLVIIGFSPLCKAFLRSLIFNWNISGSTTSHTYCCVPLLKIVVITTAGIMEADYDKDLVCPTCKEKGITCYIDGSNWSDFVRDVTTRMDIRKYIHNVSGYVKNVDREAHQVIFTNNCNIYYEKLLVLCDKNYGCPKHMSLYELLPTNYIQINSRLDRIQAYHKIDFLKNNLTSPKEKVIVIYGAHLRTYEFVNFLLEHNIPAKWIKLVIPNQRGIRLSQVVFNQPISDERIETILQDIVVDLGIKVYENMTFFNWELYEDDINISSVIFTDSNGSKLELYTDIFASFYGKFTSQKICEVLRTAGIKMHNRNILVDENFRTSDPSIYAMGNYIEFKQEPNHQYKFVSYKEAAEKLIYKLGLIPEQLKRPYEPKFSQPHSCEVSLPLGYSMFKAIMPKRYMVNHLNNEYTHSLITYNGTFTRVRLNPFGIVEEIVCVTQKKISFEFLLHFIGRHELLLNNMRARWCEEEITCFLEYFQEPWTELIMHENFNDLLEQNRKMMLPLALECMNWKTERSERVSSFKQHAHEKLLHKKLEAAFLKFIRDHRSEICQPIALPEDFPLQM